MKRIVATLVLSMFVGLANAALMRYEYNGNLLDTLDFGDPAYLPSGLTAISGYVVLSDALPGGAVELLIPTSDPINPYNPPGPDLVYTEYSFTDGATTVNQNTPGYNSNDQASFRFSTDNDGKITDWEITIRFIPAPTLSPGDHQSFFTNLDEDRTEYICDNSLLICDGVVQQSVRSNPGTWTATTVVPIPATAWLFGSALAVIPLIRRRTASVKGPH